jgi:plastocyanin
VQLGVVARDDAGGVIGNAPISYTVNNNVVTLRGSGLNTSAANGKATVTISSGAGSVQRAVPVRQKYAALVINPSAFTMVVGTNRTIAAEARDALGRPITGLTGATFISNNLNVVTVGMATGFVQSVALGNTTIDATLTSSDGTHMASATVAVSEGFPATATVTLGTESFDPTEVDIGAGGTVSWNNTSGIVHNVTFNQGGPANIPDHGAGLNARVFAAAGSYPYRCTFHLGMAGTVIVH